MPLAHSGIWASAPIDNYTVDVRYLDTDINACGDVCDAGLVLTASVGFGG